MGPRALVIAAAVIAVIIAAIASMGGGGNGKKSGASTSTGATPSANALVLDFAYSPEKEVLLKPLIARFNAAGVKAAGRPLFVRASIVSSGEAETKISKGTLKPVLWSPASSLWGRLVNFAADKPYVADDNPSIVRTPLVIAMWEPLARALGWPRKQVGFDTILKLATDTRGWAAYGKPQFGKFKLGHTNPDFSTSGLSAVAAEYYSATNKLEGLSLADVDKPAVRARIKGIESAVVHYGDTTLFFADQLKRFGPAYASAVAMEEATLIDFNNRRGSREKLIGLYPREGTFFSDNPLITVNAPWVDANERAGATAFAAWLAKEVTPDAAAKAGFRPGDPKTKPPAPIDAAHGADPALPTRVLSLPEPRVLDRIKTAWREDRKPANVMLVVDTSGSMGEENKLEQAKQGLDAFLRQLSPRDHLGLLQFSDKVTPLVKVGSFAQNRGRLRSAVRDLIPDGQTAVYDATLAGYRDIQKLNDESRINAVVVLTDGEDNQSNATDSEVVRVLSAQSASEGHAVRVYTIAYGRQANRDVLKSIAEASGGKAFEGDPKDIEAVYRSISSFF
jgi:Ca-activated chloride channel family protein